MGNKTSAAISTTVNKQIAESQVLVYSKSYCPYCDRTKAHLKSLKPPAVVVELDRHAEGASI